MWFFQFIRNDYQSINPGVKYTLITLSLLAVGMPQPGMPQPGMPQPGLPVEFDWINENWSGCSKSCASGNYPVQLTQLLLLTISCTWPAPQTTVNLWLSPSTKQRRNPCSRSVPVYHDLSTRHDWTVKNAIVNLPIRLKGNSKRISGN